MGDHTYSIARGLAAAGEDIHVWCPQSDQSYPDLLGVAVHAELGGMSIGNIRRLDASINRFISPRRVLLQWVPHGYRYQSVNLPICLWALKRAVVNGDSVEIMVHEAFLKFGGNIRQMAAASMHRIMIATLLAAASKVWLATSAWEPLLRPYCLGRNLMLTSLPIPSNVPVQLEPSRVAALRQRYSPEGRILLGHFGTYGRNIADALKALLPMILGSPSCQSFVLIGSNSMEFRDSLLASHPSLVKRVFATGPRTLPEISLEIQSCDVMLQPYPDGITTRRGSAIAALAHGRPMVTTSGELTEPFWKSSDALVLGNLNDVQGIAQRVTELTVDYSKRIRIGIAARKLYVSQFDVSHTVEALRASD